MKKLLVIYGPTATGKTSLALSLARKFNGELISADSRQVYKGMDIGTGKDIPKNARFKILDLGYTNKKLGYYEIQETKLWGYDLVEPERDFSVAQYISIAEKIINNIWNRKKLPILVGGTGFYIKGVVDGINTLQIPRNEVLRRALEEKSADELLKILTKTDPVKSERMNVSDRKNPRRLIRAIEVAKYNKNIKTVLMIRIISTDEIESLFIGLTAPRDLLNERIEKRVEDRLKQGIEKEIVNLLKGGVSSNGQSMQSLGYKQWKDYFEKFYDFGYEKRNTENTEEKSEDIEIDNTEGTELTENTERKKATELWKQAEKQYAKRQITWFKKDKRIRWFDISKKNWRNDVEKVVREWHNS